MKMKSNTLIQSLSLIICLPLALLNCMAADVPAVVPQGPQLGSADFYPSPEHPVGWRGDGTGCYPAAHPPTTWSRTQSGTGYRTTNIAWATPLPGTGVSCPIIVGTHI